MLEVMIKIRRYGMQGSDCNGRTTRIFYVVFLSVNLSVKRCGGAYGARITGANHVATACAIAAYVTKR